MSRVLAAILAAILLLTTETVATGKIEWEDRCVANAIYYEARGEHIAGQRAVYDVILHRAQSFKTSLCSVIMARKQFSWFGKVPFLPYTEDMQELVDKVKSHPRVLKNEGFRWFFGIKIMPWWAKNMECRTLGGHKFCRERE